MYRGELPQVGERLAARLSSGGIAVIIDHEQGGEDLVVALFPSSTSARIRYQEGSAPGLRETARVLGGGAGWRVLPMYVPAIRDRRGADGARSGSVLRIEVPRQLPPDHVAECVVAGMRRLWGDDAGSAGLSAGWGGGAEAVQGAWAHARALAELARREDQDGWERPGGPEAELPAATGAEGGDAVQGHWPHPAAGGDAARVGAEADGRDAWRPQPDTAAAERHQPAGSGGDAGAGNGAAARGDRAAASGQAGSAEARNSGAAAASGAERGGQVADAPNETVPARSETVPGEGPGTEPASEQGSEGGELSLAATGTPEADVADEAPAGEAGPPPEAELLAAAEWEAEDQEREGASPYAALAEADVLAGGGSDPWQPVEADDGAEPMRQGARAEYRGGLAGQADGAGRANRAATSGQRPPASPLSLAMALVEYWQRAGGLAPRLAAQREGAMLDASEEASAPWQGVEAWDRPEEAGGGAEAEGAGAIDARATEEATAEGACDAEDRDSEGPEGHAGRAGGGPGGGGALVAAMLVEYTSYGDGGAADSAGVDAQGGACVGGAGGADDAAYADDGAGADGAASADERAAADEADLAGEVAAGYPAACGEGALPVDGRGVAADRPLGADGDDGDASACPDGRPYEDNDAHGGDGVDEDADEAPYAHDRADIDAKVGSVAVTAADQDEGPFVVAVADQDDAGFADAVAGQDDAAFADAVADQDEAGFADAVAGQDGPSADAGAEQDGGPQGGEPSGVPDAQAPVEVASRRAEHAVAGQRPSAAADPGGLAHVERLASPPSAPVLPPGFGPFGIRRKRGEDVPNPQPHGNGDRTAAEAGRAGDPRPHTAAQDRARWTPVGDEDAGSGQDPAGGRDPGPVAATKSSQAAVEAAGAPATRPAPTGAAAARTPARAQPGQPSTSADDEAVPEPGPAADMAPAPETAPAGQPAPEPPEPEFQPAPPSEPPAAALASPSASGPAAPRQPASDGDQGSTPEPVRDAAGGAPPAPGPTAPAVSAPSPRPRLPVPSVVIRPTVTMMAPPLPPGAAQGLAHPFRAVPPRGTSGGVPFRAPEPGLAQRGGPFAASRVASAPAGDGSPGPSAAMRWPGRATPPLPGPATEPPATEGAPVEPAAVLAAWPPAATADGANARAVVVAGTGPLTRPSGDSAFVARPGGGWLPAVAPMVGPPGPNARRLAEAHVLVPFR